MKRHIPNFFTCLNLFCGCVAVVMIYRNHLDKAAYFVFLAAFFDLMDGLLARVLNVHSGFGKELDSLADVVSFGFVPGAVIFKLLQTAGLDSLFQSEQVRMAMQFFPFLITLFSALRLAKFNTDSRQSDSFIGLPVPANAIFIVSLPLILNQFPGRFDGIILNPLFLLVICVALSYLLISEIPLFSIKFKNLGLKENLFQYLLIIAGIILLLLLHVAAIPILFLLYFILSIIQNSLNKQPLKS